MQPAVDMLQQQVDAAAAQEPCSALDRKFQHYALPLLQRSAACLAKPSLQEVLQPGKALHHLKPALQALSSMMRWADLTAVGDHDRRLRVVCTVQKALWGAAEGPCCTC